MDVLLTVFQYAVWSLVAAIGVAIAGLIVWRTLDEWRVSSTKFLDILYGLSHLAFAGGALWCIGAVAVGASQEAFSAAVLSAIGYYFTRTIYGP